MLFCGGVGLLELSVQEEIPALPQLYVILYANAGSVVANKTHMHTDMHDEIFDIFCHNNIKLSQTFNNFYVVLNPFPCPPVMVEKIARQKQVKNRVAEILFFYYVCFRIQERKVFLC